MEFDRDLQSIQQARDFMKEAKQAQKQFQNYTQEQIDHIVYSVAEACEANAERLAKHACNETGFGNWQDKVMKNLLRSGMTYEYIKDMKTIRVIREDAERRIIDIGVPVGIIVGLIPSTNPTSTTMYKSLISLKAGNAILISPHPNARNCIMDTANVIREAATKAGAPEHIVQCIELPTMEATNVLMRHKDTGMILATGGEAMVKAAYSSGNPAIGVGPGNGPAFIERTADIKKAVKHIIDSKTFDNGTICASEQSIVVEECIRERVIDELKKQGGYFMTKEECDKVARLIMRSNHTMNPEIVGKSAGQICKLAGISTPQHTRILIAEQTEVGWEYPYSREKLCPILAFYTEYDWKGACDKCMKLLENEGIGHTMTIHSEDRNIIREFALKKPISRLLVNTAAALGGVGATTNLAPAFTLGCGAAGGSSTSDNVTPLNLINIRRVAEGVKELEELRKSDSIESGAETNPAPFDPASLDQLEIERLTREVLQNILKKG